MGNSKSKDPGSKKSKAVDKFLEEEAAKRRQHVKILILGAGESGKSTVLKQVKNVYKIPFKELELAAIKQTIQFNAVQSMNVLLKALVDLEIAVDSKTAKLVGAYTQNNTELTPASATLIAKLWQRKPVQVAWSRREQFWYLDAASYYFQHVERLGEEEYQPTEEDIVMARVRTTGISVTEFVQSGIDYSIVDVGGQRNERKKWIHCVPEHDHQILTNRGFLFLDEVEAAVELTADGAAVRDWRGLQVATYDERAQQLVFATPRALVRNEHADAPIELVELSDAAEAARWSGAPADKAVPASDASPRVSVLTTDGHDLYVRGDGAAKQFAKRKARDVLAADWSEYGFMMAAANGVARSGGDDDGAAALAARVGVPRARVVALLELFGAWLASGEPCVREHRIAFAPRDKEAARFVGERLAALGWRAEASRAGAPACSVVHRAAAELFADACGADALPAWLWTLAAPELRAVVAGVRGARGGDAALEVAGAALRDELVLLGVHAGLAAHFDAVADGRYCVRFGGTPTCARVPRSELVKRRVPFSGRTWCFDMRNGFIVTRRAERVPAPAAAILACDDDNDDGSCSMDASCAAASGAPRWTVMRASAATVQGNCFDDVKAVLFVVSLIGFNQVMFEDPDTLRLTEALTLFEQVVANPAFIDSTVILALNKKDLFEEMIRTSKLSRCFPEFKEVEDKGLQHNELLQAAIQFIQEKFEETYHSKSSTPKERRAITTHVVAARYKKDIKYMVEDIHNFVSEHRKGEPRMSAAAAAAAAKAAMNAPELASARSSTSKSRRRKKKSKD